MPNPPLAQPDNDQIEALLGVLDREIWIVTSAAAGRTGGLVATWVYQASLDRDHPVILAGIAPNHFTAELIDAAGAFAVHLMTGRQIEQALQFAIGSGRDRDKLWGMETVVGATGCPILRDCLGWLECRVFARLPTGDRTYYWADVIAGKLVGTAAPLTEHQLIAAATSEQREQLLADRLADIEMQRPLRQIWRQSIPELLRHGVAGD